MKDPDYFPNFTNSWKCYLSMGSRTRPPIQTKRISRQLRQTMQLLGLYGSYIAIGRAFAVAADPHQRKQKAFRIAKTHHERVRRAMREPPKARITPADLARCRERARQLSLCGNL